MEDFELRDIMLEAVAEVQEIVREVMEELAEPQVRTEVQKMWMQMPQDMKDQYAADNPEEHKALMDMMTKGS
jgi:ppGpp synthetase/RelA/SpoT-type nucleotidyltranferase